MCVLNSFANLRISAAGTLPQQEVAFEINIVKSKHKNKAVHVSENCSSSKSHSQMQLFCVYMQLRNNYPVYELNDYVRQRNVIMYF